MGEGYIVDWYFFAYFECITYEGEAGSEFSDSGELKALCDVGVYDAGGEGESVGGDA